MKLNFKDFDGTFEVKVEDAKIYVRPVDAFIVGEIQERYTNKGKVEKSASFMGEIIEHAIIGWEGLQDAEGKEIEFSKEKVRPIVTVLAQVKPEVLEQLTTKALYLVNLEGKEKKKSKNTSRSSRE